MLDSMMSRKSTGRPAQISIIRWPIKSTLPPKKPCTAPTAMPMSEATRVSARPKLTERRNPYSSRAATSRAPSSVPSQWRPEGGAGAPSSVNQSMVS